MPTLILLGAAGGVLRGLLDVYTRFLDWQSDRRAHRRLSPGQESEPPRFQQYFDPVGDPVAAVVHSGMGAGAAVLFGTTGQISGAYAAIVVGISAPVILTQLSRVQSVSDALTAGPPPGIASDGATTELVPRRDPVAPELSTTSTTPGSPVVAQPQLQVPTRASAHTGEFPSPIRAETRGDGLQAQSNGRPADTVNEPAAGLTGPDVPPLPHTRSLGEEGTT
ncbi:hypothetical protein [Streptomyces hokutonensis]|uniref:hypothetical protein n=1 Tax=Streptomyces hokutonensis TaxID=1306990 RepID=UPI00157BA655|nr:hypothetical protein [Streptomyces hokutonensis]